jgi:hypothetical protein
MQDYEQEPFQICDRKLRDGVKPKTRWGVLPDRSK